MRRIAVLITTFNRREHTIVALECLSRQSGIDDIQMDVYLVNDGSSDGTEEAVRTRFPRVNVLQGTGKLFWNGGMRMAFEVAMREKYDGYLWYNDDTRLDNDAVERLLACASSQTAPESPAIICGSFMEPGTRKRSYGGYRLRPNGLAMKLESVYPNAAKPAYCDTMNGNFTLIPAAIADRLGNLDKAFKHQLGDVDYGLRARRKGYRVIVAPGFFGECAGNSTQGTWRDKTISFPARWRNLMSPKGAPPSEWPRFAWRHYGWRCILYAFSPYVKVLLRR